MIKKSVLFLSVATLLAACGNHTEENTSATEAGKDTSKTEAPAQPVNELADFQFRTLIANIPSPFETVVLSSKAGVPFNKEFVNTTDKASKYTTSTKQALNYGGYIVDLVYLSANEQFSDVKNYFLTSGDLAKKLGFYESYEHVIGKRLENNVDKKDTINKIMDEVYAEMDNYLRSNDRLLTATQVLTGSWLKSQYLTFSLLKGNATNQVVLKKVVEQTYVSKKLTEILKDYEKEKEFKPVIDAVKELDALYASIHSEADLTQENINKIHDKLNQVNSKIAN